MRKLLLAFTAMLIAFSYDARASHLAGGEIFYEHVAGTVRDYKVTLIIYRDVSGIPLGNTANLSYSSSCNSGGSQSLNATPGTTLNAPVTGAYPCVSLNTPGSVGFSSYSYQGTITLPANCNDWVFYWSSCCRNPAITNINFPSGQGFLIQAKLNNNLGQNSSPVFITPPVKQFCLKGQNDPPFNWSQAAIEADGDSIVYAKGAPLDDPFPGTPIPWAPGYSINDPMSTWNGIALNDATGTFSFQPSQIEVDVFKVDVNEYRFDAALTQWVFVGSTTREMQVPILSACDQSTAAGPQINTSLPGFSTGNITADSLSNVYFHDTVSNAWSIVNGKQVYDVPVIDYNCFDDEVTLRFDIQIDISSISPDGNEFRIVGPDGILRPVIEATWKIGASPIETDEVYLKLHKKLDENGLYVLYVKRGADGNTLLNECGFELDAYYTMLINVQNCPVLEYSLDNLTVENDKDRRIDWSITDPSYLQPGLFNYWQIGMTVGGATYVRTLNDINARSFTDTEEFFPDQVDHQNFEYWVQLVQNADFKAPAYGTLITVRLRGEDQTFHGPKSSTIHFGWNAYNGFDKDSTLTEYQMYQRDCNPADSTFIGNWEKYQGQNTNYFFQDFDIDNASTAAEGLFAFKVEATDNSNPPPAGWISESNWLYVLVEYIPPVDTALPDLFAPNVFTPNDDNQNDRFYITGVNGGREYRDVQLSVFNRWGQLVYEDNNFAARNNPQQGWDGTSIYTGEKLADGVYYYTVKFSDPSTGTTEDLQGSVTILGSSK